MAEYVEREAVLNSQRWDRLILNFDRETARGIVASQPAADVVPVVRCWQCKHHERAQDPCHGRTQHYCKKLKAEVYKDFFCGYGNRKDGDA